MVGQSSSSYANRSSSLQGQENLPPPDEDSYPISLPTAPGGAVITASATPLASAYPNTGIDTTVEQASDDTGAVVHATNEGTSIPSTVQLSSSQAAQQQQQQVQQE